MPPTFPLERPLLALGELGSAWGGHGKEDNRSPGPPIGQGGGGNEDILDCIYRDCRDSDWVNEGGPHPASDICSTTWNSSLGLTGESHERVGSGYREPLVGALAGRAVAVWFLTVTLSYLWRP